MATALHSARTRFFDKCGKPLCGGTVHTYQVGTTTDKITYTDASKTAVNTNPIILDSIGSAAIFLDGAYRVRVLDRNGVLVEDIAYIESWISATEKDKIYQAIDAVDAVVAEHLAKTDNPHQVTKAQLGLSNVDNTSDVDKPISSAVVVALSSKADKATTLAGYGITDSYTREQLTALTNSVSATTYAGHKGYATLAAAQAAQSSLAANTLIEVTNDTDSDKNGVYVWDGSILKKAAAYQQVAQIIYKKYTAIVNVVKTATTTRLISVTANNVQQFFDSRIDENVAAVKTLNATLLGVTLYKKITGFTQVVIDKSNVARIVTDATTEKYNFLGGATQKKIVSGDNISVIETDSTITISTSADAYVTPTEYVLCLIAGQSNASYYGGDETLSPVLPSGMCKIWDNTYNLLRDLSDTHATVTTAKQTFAPALALEFYKQTGMGLIVVNSAVGSTAQTAAADNGAGNWSPTGTLRQTAVNRFSACQNYLNSNNYAWQNGFIIWAQGERDGQEIDKSTITKQQYKDGFIEMIDYFKTQLGTRLPFTMVTTGFYTSTGDTVGHKAVRAAQLEVAHEKSGAYIGYTGAFKFAERGLLSDNIHFSQQGKNIVGKQLGKISSKLSAGVN